MKTLFAIGLGTTAVGTAAYLVGLAVIYPGRAFSVTLIMVGITLAAIGSGGDGST